MTELIIFCYVFIFFPSNSDVLWCFWSLQIFTIGKEYLDICYSILTYCFFLLFISFENRWITNSNSKFSIGLAVNYFARPLNFYLFIKWLSPLLKCSAVNAGRLDDEFWFQSCFVFATAGFVLEKLYHNSFALTLISCFHMPCQRHCS